MPRNVNLQTNLKFSLSIPRRTKDYRQDNQKINRNLLIELKCICLSMLPRRSILGVWKLFVHAKNNFIQRQFLPVLFWICTKDARSFRQKEVFPRMRAACNINYHFHYALTISCLMWSLTVINPGITFDYLELKFEFHGNIFYPCCFASSLLFPSRIFQMVWCSYIFW